jgi:phage terminase large subunit-like protein
MTLDPRDVVQSLVLEDGRLWGDAAADFQLADVAAVFEDAGPLQHFLTRPRGGSKTTDLAAVALAWLATMAVPGARGYVVASDQDQGALLTDAAAGLVDRTPALRGVVDVGAYKLAARNGASVEVLAADGASAFGLRPALFICDEFAQWPETRNARRVWQAVISSVHKVRGCRLVILTSAGEPSHWSHKVLVEARRSDAWRVHEVSGPLPWIDPAALEAQRPFLRESEFARLHLNVWTQAEDRLVGADELAAAAVLDGPQAARPGVRYVVTLDVGLVNDACVAAVAHAEPVDAASPNDARRVVVDRLARWRGSKRSPVRLSDVEAWVEQASRDYHGAAVHADPYQAVGLIQRLQSRGVRAQEFVFSAQSVGRVAQALHLALRNRLIWLPRDDELLAELGTVRLRETAPGVVRLDHDSGQHDDQAVALGIAVSVLLDRPEMSSAQFFMRALAAERGRRVAPPPEQSPGWSVMAGEPTACRRCGGEYVNRGYGPWCYGCDLGPGSWAPRPRGWDFVPTSAIEQAARRAGIPRPGVDP